MTNKTTSRVTTMTLASRISRKRRQRLRLGSKKTCLDCGIFGEVVLIVTGGRGKGKSALAWVFSSGVSPLRGRSLLLRTRFCQKILASAGKPPAVARADGCCYRLLYSPRAPATGEFAPFDSYADLLADGSRDSRILPAAHAGRIRSPAFLLLQVPTRHRRLISLRRHRQELAGSWDLRPHACGGCAAYTDSSARLSRISCRLLCALRQRALQRGLAGADCGRRADLLRHRRCGTKNRFRA